MSDRDVTWRAFLQQQFRRLNARLGVKPFAHSPVEENVGDGNHAHALMMRHECPNDRKPGSLGQTADRKSTRLNSSHRCISYAVFCLKKKKYIQSNNAYVLLIV